LFLGGFPSNVPHSKFQLPTTFLTDPMDLLTWLLLFWLLSLKVCYLSTNSI
jgi:hypothetical protein